MAGLPRMSAAVACVMLALAAAGGAPPFAGAAARNGLDDPRSDGSLLEAIVRGLGAGAGEAFRRSAEREVPELREALRPVLAALPAKAGGRHGPTAVRYAVHRLFLQRRGWLMKGLDPQGSTWNGSSPSTAAVLAGLPRAVRGGIEAELAGRGLDLDGVAAVAALLEHQIHEEESGRLRSVFAMAGLPQSGRTELRAAARAMELYATSYVLGQHPATTNLTELRGNLESMGEIYPNWPNVQKSLRAAVQMQVQDGAVAFEGALRAARQMTDEFFKWQEPSCEAMRGTLLAMEDRGSGRVRLADVYTKALHEGKWQFSESVPYLRQLGALDESNPRNLRVIIPNYLYGASNCLATSDSLSVCCVSECEGILGSLERSLGAPEAPAAAVADHVAALASSTVPADRSLSSVMLHRLNSIAAKHGGQVPLHGRLFAQWLHHAYPRECPYPHLSGQTRPLHADDWVKVTGQEVSASPGAMARHAGFYPSRAPPKRGPLESAAWSYEEELFVPGAAEAPRGLLIMVHGTVYFAALAVTAFGFVLVRMARAGRKATAQAAKAGESRLYVV